MKRQRNGPSTWHLHCREIKWLFSRSTTSDTCLTTWMDSTEVTTRKTVRKFGSVQRSFSKPSRAELFQVSMSLDSSQFSSWWSIILMICMWFRTRSELLHRLLLVASWLLSPKPRWCHPICLLSLSRNSIMIKILLKILESLHDPMQLKLMQLILLWLSEKRCWNNLD